MKTTFYITTWNPEGAGTKRVVSSLKAQGVIDEHIKLITEKISRPKSLNKAIVDCQTPYVGMLEDDVAFSDNAVSQLETLLDRMPNIGLAIADVQQVGSERELAESVVPSRPPNAGDDASLHSCSAQMWTLNFVLLRKSTNVRFDESYFGNQVFDWDYGLELLRAGYLSVVDRRTKVRHVRTNYASKSLSYHAMVARNRHIFKTKWESRDTWTGDIPDFIPTIESLTHSNELSQMMYVSRFDKLALREHYLRARFGTHQTIARYLSEVETTRTADDEFVVEIPSMDTFPVFRS